MISQPSGDSDLESYKNYVYHSGAGEESFIYHAELGINENHDDFRSRKGEWVFTNKAARVGQNTKNESPNSPHCHSTCTASKASGNIYGAAKYATLVVVKMPDYTEASTIEILFTVYQHIKTNKRGYQAVVNVSWGSFNTYDSIGDIDAWGQRMLQAVGLLRSAGVIVVCAAGNSALDPKQGGGFRTMVEHNSCSVRRPLVSKSEPLCYYRGKP